MSPPRKRRGQPEREDLIRQCKGDDAATQREHVCIVVFPRQARCIQVVAERGANASNFVCRDLFTLTASTEHDAAVSRSVRNSLANRDANRRVVHGSFAIGAMVVDSMSERRQRLLEMLLQQK